MTSLTGNEIRRLFYYEPSTGWLIWRISSGGAKKGTIVSGLGNHGYLRAGIDGKSYLAHRLTWVHHVDKWPSMLDHANHDKTDNRIENLRQCTRAENQWNSMTPKNNTSGYKGVHFHKKHQRWQASINMDGRQIHLGYFDTAEDAHVAYCKAAAKMHGQFARTN